MGNCPLMGDPSKILRYRDSIYATDLLICAIAHLDFFTFLEDRSRTFEEICAHFSIVPRPTDVMLSLLMAMELIEKVGKEYELTDISREYLVSDVEPSLVPYYASLKNRPQCREFYEVLKTGNPAGWSSGTGGLNWIEAMRESWFADEFTSAMDSRGVYLARKMAEKIVLNRQRALLDIAGGSGVYACAIAQRYENLSATVLELSPVAAAAKRSIELKGLSGRVSVSCGDMFEEIPKGYDVHLFANVFHDWNPDSIRLLVKNSFTSLSPEGLVVVFDAHLNDDKNGPLSIAEYSCLLMHSTDGRCYSRMEISEILLEAGFVRINVSEIAADRTMITGRRN